MTNPVKLLSDEEVAEIEAHLTQLAAPGEPWESKTEKSDTLQNIAARHALALCATVRALRRSIDLAKTNAPHTKGTGEVCTDDCEGCLNPVAAIIHDRNAARGLAYQRGLEIDRAQSQIESAISLNTALHEQLAEAEAARDQLSNALSVRDAQLAQERQMRIDAEKAAERWYHERG